METRDNPFRTDRLQDLRYRLAGGTWEGLLKKLGNMNYRVAITGPHGSGKTTLLWEIERRLGDMGFSTKKLFLNRKKRSFEKGFIKNFFDELLESDIIFFDGADLMRRLPWRRFKQSASMAAGLIVTAHRAPLLPVLVECSTSQQLFRDIVRELLGEDARELRFTVDILYKKHGGNLRKGLRELYGIYASRDGLSDLTIE